MADFEPPGVGEERVPRVSWTTKLKRVFVRPSTVKTALKALDVIVGVVKIVAKVTDWLA
jgi:hypothetical protein